MNAKKILGQALKIVCFLAIAAVVLSASSKVLGRKSYEGPWNHMAKMNEFYSMSRDSIDYVGIGSSHMYCTINPLEVYNKSDITGFILATQRQPLRASYYYLKEVFKTQSPKAVFIEGYMGFDSGEEIEEAVIYDAIDPLKLSLNKLFMINEIAPEGEKENYFFNIFKYHTRWQELEQEDYDALFNPPKDFYKGYVCISGEEEYTIKETDYEKIKEKDIPDNSLSALEDMYKLCNDNGAKMVLLISAYDSSDKTYSGVIKSEIMWAQEKGIDVIDITTMYDELNIDGKTDFYDSGHFDVDGAKKVSGYISDYLVEMGLQKNENADHEMWEEDYKSYIEGLK